MNIRFIQTDELKGEKFAFRKLTCADIPDASGCQSILFNGFIFGFCSKGNINLRINNQEYQANHNELFTVLPKHTLTLYNPTDNVEIDLLLITFELTHQLPVIPNLELLKKAGNQPCIRLTTEKREEIVNLYTIIQHYTSEDNLYQSIRNTLICSLILIITSQFDILSKTDIAPQTRQDKLSREFFKLLFQYARYGKDAGSYADKLCISAKYLSAIIKRASGYPVQDWINEATLAEAKRYLRTTTLTVEEIAGKLHFTNASSFIRFFKRHTTNTPLEYRKQ